MAGSLFYMALDISFNTALWVVKTTATGVYSLVTNYIWVNEEDGKNEDENCESIELDKIDKTYLIIKELQKQNDEMMNKIEVQNQLIKKIKNESYHQDI